MVEKIKQEEFYAGLGLFFLAKRKREELDNFQRELAKVLNGGDFTKHDRFNDWIGDFIYDDREATLEFFMELLDRLQIEVCDVAQTNAELLLEANEKTKDVKQG